MYKLNKKCIIAIDGGAGVGKTTVSKDLSEKLGILYIDTGAMYRAAALYFIENNIEITDENIDNHFNNVVVDLKIENGNNVVLLNGENVTEKIRSEEVSMGASDISKNTYVRKVLVEKQRKIAGKESVVIEGRDTTTVIFPNADIKIFLTSQIDTRANRRYNDLKNKQNEAVTLEKVKNDMIKRDIQDSTRKDSPLLKAEDAIEIDTTGNKVEDTTNIILDIIEKKVGLKNI